MISNDYFDYRLGTDVDDMGNMLAQKRLSAAEVKSFVSKLYSILLLLICCVPSITIRLLLMLGSMSTFLYTQHLKPRLWLKNVAVAFICCLAPAVRFTLPILYGAYY